MCCCGSVAQWYPTLCNPMDSSSLVFTVLHHLELAHTHVHQVRDAIQTLLLCHPFSSCLQSFPASGSFPMSWLFASGGQSIGTSASASILPMKIQGWFSLGLTGLLSLQSKGVSRAHFKSINSLVVSLLCGPYMTTGKTIALTRRTFSTKWCLCFLICYLGWS